MKEQVSEVPASFEVKGVTVQSLEPRRGAARMRSVLGEDLVDETRGCVLPSVTGGGAAAADAEGNTRDAGVGQPLPVQSESEDACSYDLGGPSFNCLGQSSYYFRYVEEKEEDEGHTSNKYAEKRGFAYRPHPADVVIHSWGTTLSLAFQRAGLALFNYMTDIRLVEPKHNRRVLATGSDLKSLLYSFLTELLSLYGEDYFVASEIHIQSLDENNFKIIADARGEKFDRTRHPSGTEVKAVTMHEMGIWRKDPATGTSSCGDHETDEREIGRCVELFVAIDI